MKTQRPFLLPLLAIISGLLLVTMSFAQAPPGGWGTSGYSGVLTGCSQGSYCDRANGPCYGSGNCDPKASNCVGVPQNLEQLAGWRAVGPCRCTDLPYKGIYGCTFYQWTNCSWVKTYANANGQCTGDWCYWVISQADACF